MPLEFHCPECGQLLRVPDNTRGKKGRCPHCKAVNQIPDSPAGEKTPALPSPTAQSPPLLDAGALFHQTVGPLDALGPNFGGGANLPPQAESLADPLADAAAYSSAPFAPPAGFGRAPYAPAADNSPYASPRFAASEPEFNETIDDSRRLGMPWERRRGNALMDTVKLVLLSPAEAFGNMHRWGGVGAPLWFAVLGGFIGGVFTLMYGTVGQMIPSFISLLTGQMPPQHLGFLLLAVLINIVVGLLALAVFGTLVTLLGVLVHSAILHLVLIMLGGARAGFEATLRLSSYASGALSFLNALPCLAPLAILVMYYVVMIIGVRWTHEISVGKSVAAVLITSVVFVGVIVVPLVILVALVCSFLFAMFMRLAI